MEDLSEQKHIAPLKQHIAELEAQLKEKS